MKSFFEHLGASLEEGEMGLQPDPPPMIVLRRIGIRNFPHGEKVALYRNDKLDLNVSVPYAGKASTDRVAFAQVKEEIESLEETIIKKLKSIADKSSVQKVSFGPGADVQVQPATAKKILDLYAHPDLSFSNRVKLSRYVSSDPKEFKKVVDFVTQNS